MKALITGANGLIGAHLVRELRKQGWQVLAMVRPTSRLDALEGTDAEQVHGDVRSPAETLAPLMDGCDVIFHTAAHFAYTGFSAAELEKTAVDGSRNVLRAAAMAGVRRAVVTSSSVVFGSSPVPQVLDEHAAIGPVGTDGFKEPAYVDSKVKQDSLAIALGQALGIEVLITCPTMTVGPRAMARQANTTCWAARTWTGSKSTL
jgi:dihydroflavonol-4-reductase